MPSPLELQEQQQAKLAQQNWTPVPMAADADDDDEMDGGLLGGGAHSGGSGGGDSASIFRARQLITFWQLLLLLTAAFVVGGAISGGAVYSWVTSPSPPAQMPPSVCRMAVSGAEAIPAAATNANADAAASAPAPGVPAPTSTPADAPLSGGCRSSFYHGPQHQVRFPAVSYLSTDAPFCHYEHPDGANAQPASRDALLNCINGARASYDSDPLQSTKLPCNRRRKVFDTFRYNDEVEMLETRIEENWNVVDYFIVVESPMAFVGTPKEMGFAAAIAAGNYSRWMSKIIHVTCDLYHINTPNDNESNQHRGWAREFATTDCVQFGLGPRAGPDDIVMYGDTDEIPRPNLISALQMCSAEMSALGTPTLPMERQQALRLSGPRFLGSWKWQHYPGFPAQWTGTTILLRHALLNRGGGAFRGHGALPVTAIIADGLWHCSTCIFGNLQRLYNKLDRWSEQGATASIRKQLSDPNYRSPFDDCGASSEASTCTLWTRVDQLPKWVRDHPEQYHDRGYTA